MGITKGITKSKQPLVFECRRLGQPQINRLSAALTNTECNDVLDSDDVSKCSDDFMTHFHNVLGVDRKEWVPVPYPGYHYEKNLTIMVAASFPPV